MPYAWEELENDSEYSAEQVLENEYGVSVGTRTRGKRSLSGMIQRDADGAHGLSPEAIMAAVGSASESSGEALPPEFRAELQAALGLSVDGVRVHTGAASEGAASDLSAKAFTVGQDIHFARGQYRPETEA